jgi:phosphoglycolate phosphatase
MIESYVQTYRENYRQIHRSKTLLLPGAGEAVKHAACRARLGVVTTKTGRYSQELLEHFGLMEYFEKDPLHFHRISIHTCIDILP